jgi:hypothetical protein
MRDSMESQALASSDIDHRNDQIDMRAIERRMQEGTAASDRPDGISSVELDKINPTDIKSAADFDSPQQYRALLREAQMLQQMDPALKQGSDVETFHAWDKANAIGQYSPDAHVRGYADVYHSYHGTDAIALDPRPDGTFDVINGRHRIVAARDAGLREVPARVVG